MILQESILLLFLIHGGPIGAWLEHYRNYDIAMERSVRSIQNASVCLIITKKLRRVQREISIVTYLTEYGT